MVVVGADGAKVSLANGDIQLFDKDGLKRAALCKLLSDFWTDFLLYFYKRDGLIAGGMGSFDEVFHIFAPDSTTGELAGHKAQWKDNGDGTFTLVGQ